MEEIFKSDEFKRLEALCNTRKLSFVLAVYKGGGGVHRPKKGPTYVMSDFFMYEIPTDWERQAILTTPSSTWVNPRPLPLLSQPLSQLANKPAEIKHNFVQVWDHFHGVLTESYFCPKLYLTKMSRATIEKWMPTSILPEGETLSCADLVLFPAFVQWVRAATSESDGEAQIRLGFVALLLHLACSLYGVDPELHTDCYAKTSTDQGKASKNKVEVVIDDELEVLDVKTSKAKSPGQISCVASSKLLNTPARLQKKAADSQDTPSARLQSVIISSVISKAPAAHAMKTVIPTDVMAELDKIPNITLTPKKDLDDTDDIIEILDSPQPTPQPTPAKKKFNGNVATGVTKEVEKTVFVVDSQGLTHIKVLKEKQSNVVSNVIDLDCDSKGPDLSKVKESHKPKENQNKTMNNGIFVANQGVVTNGDMKKLNEATDKEDKKAEEAAERQRGKRSKELAEIQRKVEEDNKRNRAEEARKKKEQDKNKKKKEEDESRIWEEKKKKKEELKAKKEQEDEVIRKEKWAEIAKARKAKEAAKQAAEVEARKAKLISDEEAKKAKEAKEEKSRRVKEAVEEKSKNDRKLAAEEFKAKRAMQAEERERQQQEDNIRNAISASLGRLIQVVIKKMSQEDYNKFSRKVSKNLNSLDTTITDVDSLQKVIDAKRELVLTDENNVFLHIKGVFDELKKYKKAETEVSKETEKTSEPAKTEHVFRWMDGNDNPAEVGAAPIEIDNADVDVSLQAEEKKDTKIVSSTSNIKEMAEMKRKEIEDAAEETMEYLITETVKAQKKEKSEHSGKRKADEANEPAKKKVCLTSVIKVPEKQESKENEPAKKKIGLTTISNKVPEKSKEESVKKKVALTAVSKVATDPESKKEELTKKKVDISTITSVIPDQPSASIDETSPEKEKSPVMDGNGSATSVSDKPAKKVSEKHIAKLEEALKKCSKKIKAYEEKEVDWDNEAEEESNYLMTARLKRRCMQIYSKIAEAKALSDSLDRKTDKRLKCSESRYPEINKKIEKFVNRTKQFPDFQDIRKLVKDANKDLHLSEPEMHAEAESIFQAVGKTMKRRREADDHEVQQSYLKEDETEDPARESEELETRLREQAEEGREKMNVYLDTFYKENVIKAKQKDDEGGEKDEEDLDEQGQENEGSGNEEEGEGEEEEEEEDEESVEAENQGGGTSISVTPTSVSDDGESETSDSEDDSGGEVQFEEESAMELDQPKLGEPIEVIELDDEVSKKSVDRGVTDTSNIENEVPKV